MEKKTNKKLVESKSKLNTSNNLTRIKSLIKPPSSSRYSWELLLDDYLEDPNLKFNLMLKLSPDNFPLHEQSNHPLPQSFSPNSFQQTFTPSSYNQYPQYSSYIPYQTLPPRRYQMTLDELVYLISQVGRSDLYREMVQYIKSQQLSTSSTISFSGSTHKPANINTRPTTTDSFLLNNTNKKNKPDSSRNHDH